MSNLEDENVITFGQKSKRQREKRTLESILSDRTIYSIHRRRSGNIVDLVLKIMDGDGPKPMKNMRPAQKTRNGADQFEEDHHGEYEAREQQSRDRIARVQTHNSAYPKMYDELNKRRSTAQLGAFETANRDPASNMNFGPDCRICVRLKRQTELNERSYKPRRSRKRSSKTKSNLRYKKTRVTKPKRSKPNRYSRCPSRKFKLSKIMKNKGCQCTSYFVPAVTKSVIRLNESFFVPSAQETATVPSNQDINENNDSKNMVPPNLPRKASKTSKSDIDSGNPGTSSAPSNSSYNSFMSMEHEPMIE